MAPPLIILSCELTDLRNQNSQTSWRIKHAETRSPVRRGEEGRDSPKPCGNRRLRPCAIWFRCLFEVIYRADNFRTPSSSGRLLRARFERGEDHDDAEPAHTRAGSDARLSGRACSRCHVVSAHSPCRDWQKSTNSVEKVGFSFQGRKVRLVD